MCLAIPLCHTQSNYKIEMTYPCYESLMRTCCLGFILMLLNVFTAQAIENDAEMTIADSHVRLLQSEIGKQEYQLLIKTPAGYGETDKPIRV
jgi:hypothetical protein